jgi:hypothetical protein
MVIQLTIVNFINILRAAFVPIFFCKKLPSQTVFRELLHKALTYGKVACKMLIKFTLGVDFTNIFMRRFYARSSQKLKSQSSHQYLFTLLGSGRVKAICRTLMKLSPWWEKEYDKQLSIFSRIALITIVVSISSIHLSSSNQY